MSYLLTRVTADALVTLLSLATTVWVFLISEWYDSREYLTAVVAVVGALLFVFVGFLLDVVLFVMDWTRLGEAPYFPAYVSLRFIKPVSSGIKKLTEPAPEGLRDIHSAHAIRLQSLRDLKRNLQTYTATSNFNLTSLVWNVLWCLVWSVSTGYWRRIDASADWQFDSLPLILVYTLDVFITGAVVEFCLKVVAAPSLLRLVGSKRFWVDIMALPPAILVAYVLGVPDPWLTFGWIRWLRLFLMAEQTSFEDIQQGQKSRGNAVKVILALLLLVLAFTFCMFVAEGSSRLLGSRWDKEVLLWVYFTVVTVSTVGYGDIVPVTAYGRVACTAFIVVLIAWIPRELARYNKLSRESKAFVGRLPRSTRRTVILMGDVSPYFVKLLLNTIRRSNFYLQHRQRVGTVMLLTPMSKDIFSDLANSRRNPNFVAMTVDSGIRGALSRLKHVDIVNAKAFLLVGDASAANGQLEARTTIVRVLALQRLLYHQDRVPQPLSVFVRHGVEKTHTLLAGVSNLTVSQEFRNALLALNVSLSRGVITAVLSLVSHLVSSTQPPTTPYETYVRLACRGLMSFPFPSWAHGQIFDKIAAELIEEYNVLLLGLQKREKNHSWDFWLNPMGQSKIVDVFSEEMLCIADSQRYLEDVFNSQPVNISYSANTTSLRSLACSPTDFPKIGDVNFGESCEPTPGTLALVDCIKDAQEYFASEKPILLICGTCSGFVRSLPTPEPDRTHQLHPYYKQVQRRSLGSQRFDSVDVRSNWQSAVVFIKGQPVNPVDLRKAGVFGASSYLVLPRDLVDGLDGDTSVQDTNVLMTRHAIRQLLDYFSNLTDVDAEVTCLVNHNSSLHHFADREWPRMSDSTGFLTIPAFASSEVLSEEMLLTMVVQDPEILPHTVHTSVLKRLIGLGTVAEERWSALEDPTRNLSCGFKPENAVRISTLPAWPEPYGSAVKRHQQNCELPLGVYRPTGTRLMGPHFLVSPPKDFSLLFDDCILVVPALAPVKR